MSFSSIRHTWYTRSISYCLVITFITSMVIAPKASYAQEGVMGLPQPGAMVSLSPAYVPLMVTGLTIHPENPLLMDFIVNTGNSGMDAAQVKKESDRLIKYFLACLTIPENNQWVNLSPYEKQRIIPEDLGQTVLGQDMLAQDYILKQLTASLIYPEKNLGKNFWNKVYAKANQMYGTTQIPVNTFNKVWILPDTADVYEHKDTVFVVKSHLKVMLDEDYLSLQKHVTLQNNKVDPISVNDLGSKIIRKIILPSIEQEVNTGKNFARLRQIYNSMILAVWFKKNLKQALLNQVYTDKSKVNGVNADDPAIKQRIYEQYLEAYKKGVFNFIKEDMDRSSHEVVPRKYFSGGLTAITAAMLTKVPVKVASAAVRKWLGETYRVAIEAAKAKGSLVRNAVKRFVGIPSVSRPNVAMVQIERLSPEQIIERFHLPPADALYLSVLIAKYLSDRTIPVLGKNSIASALLNKAARQVFLGVIDGQDVMNDPENLIAAKKVNIRVLELKGGIGNSFKRELTLKRLTGRDKLADKGTDSYFEGVAVDGFDADGKPKVYTENISVAELKLLHYIYLAQQNDFNEIEVQELVNSESLSGVDNFWNTVYLADRVDARIPEGKKRTYRQIFSKGNEGSIKGLSFNPDYIVQGVLPVVDAKTGAYLNDAKLNAPGGHGAFVALTMDVNARNQRDLSVPRITVFTNGDGVNNMLPPAVAGWMVRNRAPIVMVTTNKQLLDLKGGLITLLSNKDLPADIQAKLARFETLSMDDIADLQKTLYPYLLEIAQTKGVEGQKEIFQKMGIILGEKSAQFFNTNVHAQNHNVLDPFLAELKGIIGEERYYEMIGPDLILNEKDKKNSLKEKVKVLQLEGASGSALLAMNRFILTTEDPRIIALKKKYGITRLVYFVNFNEQLRSEVFTPEKYTWDHYLYAFTDLFSVDPKRGRLVYNPNPNHIILPGFDLGNETPYEDLEYDINAFGRHLGVKELKYLAIRGEVRIVNAELKGGVFIKNRSGQVVDLTTKLPNFIQKGRLVLDNVFISIDEKGDVTTRSIGENDLLDTIVNFETLDAAMQTSIDDGVADETRTNEDVERQQIVASIHRMTESNPANLEALQALVANVRKGTDIPEHQRVVLQNAGLLDNPDLVGDVVRSFNSAMTAKVSDEIRDSFEAAKLQEAGRISAAMLITAIPAGTVLSLSNSEKVEPTIQKGLYGMTLLRQHNDAERFLVQFVFPFGPAATEAYIDLKGLNEREALKMYQRFQTTDLWKNIEGEHTGQIDQINRLMDRVRLAFVDASFAMGAVVAVPVNTVDIKRSKKGVLTIKINDAEETFKKFEDPSRQVHVPLLQIQVFLGTHGITSARVMGDFISVAKNRQFTSNTAFDPFMSPIEHIQKVISQALANRAMAAQEGEKATLAQLMSVRSQKAERVLSRLGELVALVASTPAQEPVAQIELDLHNQDISVERAIERLTAFSSSPLIDSLPDGLRQTVREKISTINEALTVEVKPLAQTRLVEFGTSGHRGRIDINEDGRDANGLEGADFNIALVRRIVQGIADHILHPADPKMVINRTIIIGYDTRYRNPEFSKEAARIMAGNGFKVLYAAEEATPTPVLAILASNRNVDGVINFTASHSPYTDGGIKFSPSHGGAADDDTTKSIQTLANQAQDYKVANYEEAVKEGEITELDPQATVAEYVNGYLIPTMQKTKAKDGISAWDDIVNYVKHHPEFNLVIDPMQGTGVRTMQILYGKIAEAAGRPFFRMIHTDNKDPKFTQTGGAPQPAGKYIQGLLGEVKGTPHSMGVAVDGDVDRFGVVDFGGRQFEANEMIGLFAWFLKKDIGLDGSLIKTVATSNFANAVAQHLGMKLIETKVGFKHGVKLVMGGENALVIGEESAHVGIGPFMRSWDDGFAVGLTALWLVARSGKTLAEYKAQIESEIKQSFVLKVHTARDEQGVAKANVIALIAAAKKEMETTSATEISLAKKARELTGQKVASINTLDGVKLVFESGDSILMRPSGTEPAAKLYVEVSKEERMDTMFSAATKLMGVNAAQLVLTVTNSFEDEDAILNATRQQGILGNRKVTPGGIDLNSKNLHMQSTGQKVSITFNQAMIAQFRHGDFSGVQFRILDVELVDVMPLLGSK